METRPTFLQLINTGEPFRLLFPVGLLLGGLGAVLWPLWALGVLETYPGIIHSRIMIQGYMSAFVLGFLGTALPRMLGIRGFGVVAAIWWALGLVLLSACHLFQRQFVGDLLFLAVLSSFVIVIIGRLHLRTDLPPPAFVLVAAGFSCAMAGTILQIAIVRAPGALPQFAFPLARLLLNQAFLLLPVMGVGAFFLPRYFGLPNRQDFPESLDPPPGWLPRALFAGLCGLILITSFIMEAADWLRSAYLIRAGVLLIYFLLEVPAFRQFGPLGSLATAVRIALLSLPLSYVLMAVWPLYRTSLAHGLFITGFSLLAFAVATWVMLGHSGQSDQAKQPSWAIRLMVPFLIGAMLTRVTADWLPEIRNTHYAYASVAFLVAAGIWAIRFLPAVRRPDTD